MHLRHILESIQGNLLALAVPFFRNDLPRPVYNTVQALMSGAGDAVHEAQGLTDIG